MGRPPEDGAEIAAAGGGSACDTDKFLKELQARIKELHPYRLPSVVAYPAAGGSPDYLDWVRKGSKPRHF